MFQYETIMQCSPGRVVRFIEQLSNSNSAFCDFAVCVGVCVWVTKGGGMGAALAMSGGRMGNEEVKKKKI